jgi:hypothetical protein
MDAAGISPAASAVSPASEHVLRPGRLPVPRREHAVATLGTERRDLSILPGPVCDCAQCISGSPGIIGPKAATRSTDLRHLWV